MNNHTRKSGMYLSALKHLLCTRHADHAYATVMTGHIHLYTRTGCKQAVKRHSTCTLNSCMLQSRSSSHTIMGVRVMVTVMVMVTATPAGNAHTVGIHTVQRPCLCPGIPLTPPGSDASFAHKTRHKEALCMIPPRICSHAHIRAHKRAVEPPMRPPWQALF
jgi:hypothetical protein